MRREDAVTEIADALEIERTEVQDLLDEYAINSAQIIASNQECDDCHERGDVVSGQSMTGFMAGTTDNHATVCALCDGPWGYDPGANSYYRGVGRERIAQIIEDRKEFEQERVSGCAGVLGKLRSPK